MNELVTAVLYVVGIGGMFLLLIAPHEGGHFLFAKLFKVRVIEFSIGAGTKVWSVTRGGKRRMPLDGTADREKLLTLRKQKLQCRHHGSCPRRLRTGSAARGPPAPR